MSGIRMTRRVTFSAGKVDWPAHGSVETIPGADRGPETAQYGHNYLVDVTVTGEINPITGVIVNIKEIDRIVRERVIDRLDRRLIHLAAPEFTGRPVTPESLAAWIAARLENDLPAEVALAAIRVEETPLVSGEWTARGATSGPGDRRGTIAGRAAPGGGLPHEHGGRSMEPTAAGAEVAPETVSAESIVRATRVYEFAASHRLHSPHLSDEENREMFGKCNYPNGHGHNYVLEVTVEGPVDAVSGHVICPHALDEVVNREVVDRYDHRHFNYDIPEFAGLIPSTEVVTKVIWQRLAGNIPPPARLASVLIRETARNIFEYRGEA